MMKGNEGLMISLAMLVAVFVFVALVKLLF
jgi:hypothetical protein